MSVACLLVVEVNEVDFLVLTPWNALAVKCCDAVGREVCHLYFKGVAAWMEEFRDVKFERNGPKGTSKLSVYRDFCAFANITKI